ncbi:MAG: PEP-CTERM sorting domain-containing protein [Chthoniobacterales bacterium]
MKTKSSTALLTSSVQTRLALCAAALTGTAAVIPETQAAVISFSGSFSVPQTPQGLYFNFATGAVTGAPGAGWDFNPYFNPSPFAIYWAGGAPGIAGGVTTGAGSTTYMDLSQGFVVSAASNFSNALQVAGATTNLLPAGMHILGFRFVNEGTGATNYGYLTMTSGSANGFPLTITGWSFEDSGGAITVVPEPATMALLGVAAMVLGALGLRKWRRANAA